MSFTIRNPNLQFQRPRTQRSSTVGIVLHHLDAHWTVERTHAFHQSRGWNGIGYNFHVAMDGTISLGRGMEFVGAHTNPPAGINATTIGIGCEGRFHSVDRTMSVVQFNALIRLIQHLRGVYGDIWVKGHRDLAPTACPGQFFPLAEVQKLQFRGTTNHADIQEEEMTQEQFNQMMDTYLTAQQQHPISAWAKESWELAVNLGITDGTSPGAPATREQVVTMLNRLELLR